MTPPSPSPSPSIEHSVARAYLVSIVSVAVAIVLVGALMATVVVVRRDDHEALAVAQTMASELGPHDQDPKLDALVSEELDEQRWFHRQIEVWRGATRIGATGPGRLHDFGTTDGCHSGRLGSTLTRFCSLGANSLRIVIASPMAPLFVAELPLVLAIAAVAALAVLIFSLLSRRLIRRSLEPLRRFEARLAALAPLDGDVQEHWGASEIDTLALTFRSLLRRIADTVEREHRFVSNAAHELRTPLTRLRGQIELALAEAQLGPEPSRRLTLAVRTCEELARSTDALLALARDELGRRETVELGEVAAEVLRTLTDAERARITLTDPSVAAVRGDEILLTLAVRNLVDNALKYSDGPIELCIAGCTIQVIDHGRGIPPDEIEDVRRPFVRGRDRQETRGTGLGLALADHVADLHGGELLLENHQGLHAILKLPPWTPVAVREPLG